MNFDIRQTTGLTEIYLKGRLGFSDHVQFRQILSAFEGPAGHRVVFNLSDLQFVDSSGLGMFIIARDEAKKKELDFSIEGVRADIKRVMDMARFDRFFNIKS